MIYKKIKMVYETQDQIYARIDDDGICRVTCNGNNPDFKAWIAAGNLPQEADA